MKKEIRMNFRFAFPALFLAATVHAGPVNVPNTFQGGTAALAAEVNENFSAIEGAVDDNAERIATLESEVEAANTAIDGNTSGIADNAENLATLQLGGLGAGIPVRVGDDVVGRFVTQGLPPEVQVDVSGTAGAATEIVAQRTGIGTTESFLLVSNTGYLFGISTTDFGAPPRGAEGTLDSLSPFYASSNCSGQAYFPVEGPMGFFSTFEPGTGDKLPLRRWFARQGFAFRSPNPAAVNEAFMVRRNQTTQQLTLNSIYVWSEGISQAQCVDLAFVPGYAGNESHSVVVVEPLDSTETGIPGDMGGPISLGLVP